jgi:hypothetical protein
LAPALIGQCPSGHPIRPGEGSVPGNFVESPPEREHHVGECVLGVRRVGSTTEIALYGLEYLIGDVFESLAAIG